MADVLDSRLLALTALVTIGFQAFFFLITYALRFDKVTDFAGTTNFLVLTVITLTVGGHYNARQVVVSTCIFAWGARLCAFLLYRIILWGEDRRFDDKRNSLLNLSIFWALQAVWVWTVSLPTTILNSKALNPSLNGLDYAGWAIFALGALLEAVADQQKLLYKQTPESRGRWTDVGVWRYSRHPNYFAEIALWWGLYLSAVNVLRGAEHAAVAGPIFITLLLMFVSGIPLLERTADEKHGRKEDYVVYKARTSVLIPLPPALYARLPGWVKRTLLLDFGLYNPGAPEAGKDVEDGSGRPGAPTEVTGLVEIDGVAVDGVVKEARVGEEVVAEGS